MRPIHTIRALLMCAALTLGTSAVWATTIYDEGVQGDLDIATAPTLTLAIGGNSIVGASHFYGSESGHGDDLDADPFAFIVPSGTWVQSVTIAFTTQRLTGIPYTQVTYRLSDANFQEITRSPAIDLFGASPVTLFGDVVPIPNGQYRWDEAGWSSHISTASEWNYEITFDVVPVPEPSIYALLSTGVMLLGLAVRRRRRA